MKKIVLRSALIMAIGSIFLVTLFLGGAATPKVSPATVAPVAPNPATPEGAAGQSVQIDSPPIGSSHHGVFATNVITAPVVPTGYWTVDQACNAIWVGPDGKMLNEIEYFNISEKQPPVSETAVLDARTAIPIGYWTVDLEDNAIWVGPDGTALLDWQYYALYGNK